MLFLHLNQRRLLRNTSLMSEGTTRMEPTARRRIDGTGNLTTNHSRPSISRVRHRNSSDQSLSIRVKRKIDKLRRTSRLHNLTKIHNRNTITNMLAHGKIMRDEDHRDPLLLNQINHQVQNLCPDRNIQHRDRLVSNHKLRAKDES